jgi:hypothetical protein
VGSPTVRAVAGNVANGDFDFYWKQVQPTYSKPGFYVFPSETFWQEIPVTANGDALSVDTSALPAGIYKVRVEVADGTKAF